MDAKKFGLAVSQMISKPSCSSTEELSNVLTPSEYCLTNFALIVQMIFKQLTARQLCSAAKVCKFWYEVAKREKRKRVGVETRMVYEEDEEEDTSDDSMKLMKEIQNVLVKRISDSRCYPSLAILYINRSERFYGVSEENGVVRQMLRNLRKTLPKATQLVGALAGGVIGCPEDFRVEEVEQTESASLLLLPQSPTLKVHTFFLKLTDVRTAGQNLAEWDRLIGCPKSLEPKLALIHACCETNEVQDTVNMLSQLFGNQLPVAGGIAEYLVDNNRLKCKGISGILLGGNISVTLRVSVGPDVSNLRENLEDMKRETGVLPNSIMLMYSCVARGQQLYEKPNTETGCVKDIFGTIPAFGFFAFGEIGKFQATSRSIKRDTLFYRSAVHSFSTVSCYCSFE